MLFYFFRKQMADHVSVTSHHSYGSRVWNSLRNIFGGILFVILSIVLLVRNEHNFVQQKAALKEWASVVQEASANQIDSLLEWQEVHLYGETASEAEALQDNTFGVTVNDLKLKRTVEMYQWYEESDETCTDNYGWSEDCTTTYDYYKKWSDSAINSNDFYESNGHNNPSTWKYTSQEWEKHPITLWVYTLTTAFVNQLSNYTNINLGEQNINIPAEYTNIINNGSVEDNNNSYLYWESENASSDFHVQNDYIYIGKDSSNPTVWDLRISFSSVKTWAISIVWKQLWNELTSYTTSNWRSIALLQHGNVTAEDMFIKAQKDNQAMTWMIRFIWLLLMFCGFSMMLQFVETIAKVIPFLSKIAWAWTKLIALAATIVVGFVTIWLAWIAVRPVVWICCLVVAAGGIFLLVRWKKNKNAEATVIETPAKPENKEIKE